jgi:hypothetical protein
MRTDLSRIRDIPRGTVIAFVVLIAGVFASAWLVKDVAKREKAIEVLKVEVGNNEIQANALAKSGTAPMTPEQLSEKMGPLIVSDDKVDDFREQLATAATENRLEVRKLELSPVTVNPASTEAEDLALLSLQISKYILVTIDFHATYEDSARFLSALEQMPQRVLIRGAELRRDAPNNPKISGTVTLRVYQNNS